MAENKITCDLCPRNCRLKDGQAGFCRIRKNEGGKIVLTDYGYITSIQIDPVEKKPLYHFLPGKKILSIGMQGCNLYCRFCQNHSIAHPDKGQASALNSFYKKKMNPEFIVSLANHEKIPMIAFTYNEPIIAMEFVQDTFSLARHNGIRNVLVTNGYISPKYYDTFFQDVDATNIDLKFFREEKYRKFASGSLRTVLDTIQYVYSRKIALEITTLVIPGVNDSDEEIRDIAAWISRNLSPSIPLHLSAFHPDFKMLEFPATSPDVLTHFQKVARDAGLNHVYTGNIQSENNLLCPRCGKTLITRHIYQIKIDTGFRDTKKCPDCGMEISDIHL